MSIHSKRHIHKLLFVLNITILTGCIASPPKQSDDLCAVFLEKDDWYQDSKAAFVKWGTPVHVQMAIMHQESRFVADAKPPRPFIFGVIPWFRSSDAYGYAQAKDSTWDWYQQKTGNHAADRDDFADAADFIGWYCTISYTKLGISKWDARNQYLAYHEGHGGYQRKTYLQKKWLLKVADKVDKRARRYASQLHGCAKELEEKQRGLFW